MRNGDLETGEEPEELLKTYGREQVLLYTCCERFFVLYKNNWIDTTQGIENAYAKDFVRYLEKEGLHFTGAEKRCGYMKQAYRNFFGRDVDVDNIPVEKHDFLKDNGRLCEIGRSSKLVRDKDLLRRIEAAFERQDKVFIVFGGAHAIAMEPALTQLMKRCE